MSWTLFKANIKANRGIWIIMCIVFSFYVAIILTMFDPNGIETLNEMLKMMPEAFVRALNFQQLGNTLLTFITGYLYGFLIFLFPMVLSIVVNHHLVASHVDRGSMSYLLSTPNSRTKIALTQALFSIVSITAFFMFIVVFTILLTHMMFPGELETGKYILVNIYALLMYYAIGGIGFLSSCIFNESKYSLGFGMGIPLGFLVLQMLGNTGEELEWIKNFSMYTLFNPDKLIANEAFAYIGMAIFLGIAIVLYICGIAVFNKKDMLI